MYRAILVTLALVSTGWASPQWLQYRTSERARDITGNGGSAFHRPEKEKPNIAVPQLSCDAPIFIKWATPMDPAGFRWAVFDKKSKLGSYFICYFDANGNGRLDDDARIEGIQTNEYEIEFGNVPVLFQSDDGPITYHLNLRFFSYDEDSTYVYASAGCWYEGQIEIDGQKQRCMLVDLNVNGTFDDKSENESWDRIVIGPENSSEQFYVGNYLEYKDKLYRQNVARDGAFIELSPAPDVPYGMVSVPREVTEISACGLNGMYKREVKDGQISLPEGEYQVYRWQISRKDVKGVDWRLEASYPSNNASFTVGKDKPATISKIGEPVFSSLNASGGEGSFYFNQSLAGQLGERISLYRENRQAPAPKIHIVNKAGDYDRTFSLEYG